jgi:formate hydrogenlyase transcriptional activator
MNHEHLMDSRSVVLAAVSDCTRCLQLEMELTGRQEFERAVAEIASGFLTAPDDQVDDHINASQRRVSELLAVDRSTLWQVDSSGALLSTHVWTREAFGVKPSGDGVADHCPWSLNRVRAGQIVAFRSLEEIPDTRDRDGYRRCGSSSAVMLPLQSDGRLIGCLGFATARERAWDDDSLERLRLVGAVLANALACREAHRELGAAQLEMQQLRERLAGETVHLQKEVHSLKGVRMLASESSVAQRVVAEIAQVAPTTASVLLLGETGVGKEVFAEVLHELSPRRHKRMVRVNCAAIPSALIESELFGRERGAYTGAISRQLGRFELADHSTIFLDEVGDLPLEVQAKLLRVLQDHVVERLGSPQQIKVDVRVIAATNRDLEQAVADRTFREDLFYRLNVFPIRVPALRERVEDIPTLVWSFINEFSVAFGKNIESLSKGSLQALQAYAWPGNIRELRNVVERAVIVSTGPQLVIGPPQPLLPVSRRKSLRFVDVEVEHLRSVLDATGWRIRGAGGAADVLGIKPTTLESRMAKLGIVRSSKPAGEPMAHHAWPPGAQRHGQDD